MSVATPALVTEAQAAEFLGVSLSTIRRWRKAGTLSAFRVGDILRYHTAVLDEFIAAHSSGSNSGGQN
jgi:excisionase family DNA binding protein